ncbi:MAG: hypothetical protein IJE80_07715, partial [Peptococcaceae bacterium]|nr:hypothetical protein [Peptococcaceae bacterium]
MFHVKHFQSQYFATTLEIVLKKVSSPIVSILNNTALLPPDVRIRASREVPKSFHARFSTKGKRYRYLFQVSPHAGALNRHT